VLRITRHELDEQLVLLLGQSGLVDRVVELLEDLVDRGVLALRPQLGEDLDGLVPIAGLEQDLRELDHDDRIRILRLRLGPEQFDRLVDLTVPDHHLDPGHEQIHVPWKLLRALGHEGQRFLYLATLLEIQGRVDVEAGVLLALEQEGQTRGFSRHVKDHVDEIHAATHAGHERLDRLLELGQDLVLAPGAVEKPSLLEQEIVLFVPAPLSRPEHRVNERDRARLVIFDRIEGEDILEALRQLPCLLAQICEVRGGILHVAAGHGRIDDLVKDPAPEGPDLRRRGPGERLREDLASPIELSGFPQGQGQEERRPGLARVSGMHLIEELQRSLRLARMEKDARLDHRPLGIGLHLGVSLTDHHERATGPLLDGLGLEDVMLDEIIVGRVHEEHLQDVGHPGQGRGERALGLRLLLALLALLPLLALLALLALLPLLDLVRILLAALDE